MPARLAFRRILLKLSGEALKGRKEYGLDMARLSEVAEEIQAARDKGVELAVVVGGGNIFRGLKGEAFGLERVAGDHMGMLATLINALALKQALKGAGAPAEVLSAFAVGPVAPTFNRSLALKLLAEGQVVLFGGGTGLPFFSTDTAAALRAAEIGADALFKATKVDGVYDSDPEENPAAKRFERLSYQEVLSRGLRVMDLTAVSLCQDNDLPVLVFKLAPGNLEKALSGHEVGTLIRGEER